MIEIDGSQGEGGGQVLRTALALSVVTGKAVRLYNIRAGRPKPGLKPQHLKAVEAAAAISGAAVEGAKIDSQILSFDPRGILPGTYRFDIGTAGATTLVLQTIFLPLSFATAESRVTITGGTHVPWSPCYHYLAWHWSRYMHQIGFRAGLALEKAGFYPRGGGEISAVIHPHAELKRLRLTGRGALKRIHGVSAVANLEVSIAERQRRQALQRLGDRFPAAEIAMSTLSAVSKGTVLLVIAEFENSQCCFYSLGAPGKPAETVADEAVDELEAFFATDGAIDPYLADQLVLPLAFAPAVSEFRPSKLTQHLVTNAEVVTRFLPATIEISGEIGKAGLVTIRGAGDA